MCSGDALTALKPATCRKNGCQSAKAVKRIMKRAPLHNAFNGPSYVIQSQQFFRWQAREQSNRVTFGAGTSAHLISQGPIHRREVKISDPESPPSPHTRVTAIKYAPDLID
jgi:hypothetical protein